MSKTIYLVAGRYVELVEEWLSIFNLMITLGGLDISMDGNNFY